MVLTAKIGQLNHPTAHSDGSTGAGAAVADIESRIRRGEVGSLAGGGDLARLAELQRIAVEESPQGIPLLFTLDVLHGHRTIFPLPLGLACAWDPNLARRTARVAAVEDRKTVGEGKGVSVRVDLGRRCILKTKKKK